MKGNKYLRIQRVGSSSTGKTERWEVLSTSSGALLGCIAWYGRWRQYVFVPSPDTIFNPDCLDTISAFIRGATDNHKTLGGQPYGGSHG